jgi:hypothetical protein
VRSAHVIYQALQLPLLQNRVFPSAEAARSCEKGDVVLVQSPETGLIFNDAFDPSAVRYGADYQNEQGYSDSFRRHLNQVEAIIRRRFGNRHLVEIGCGKAHFLEILQRQGFDIVGFDPAYEGTNPCIRREYFTRATETAAGGIILRHVLEHAPDPVKFLGDIRDANSGRGIVYVEVPCFDWISRSRSWFDIYYEHVNYFRLSDLERMFGTVVESGQLFGGQYIYVVADLATLQTPCSNFAPAEIPSDFLDGVARHAQRLLHAHGRPGFRAAWGAASKGVIFSLFMERAGAPLDAIIDINPSKQNRYIPASGLRVQSPLEAMELLQPGSDVFVMNSNYLPEIARMSSNRFTYVTVEHEAN